jgi:hypothetical protein
MMNFYNKTEMQRYLPRDLLSKVTILLQDSGYVTIKPKKLTRPEWRRFKAHEWFFSFMEMKDKC